MIFRIGDKEYTGVTAAEVVRQLASETREFAMQEGGSLYEFLRWSLARLGDRIPPRELDLSNRLNDEILARNYLLLRDEYNLGELIEDA